jgi:hypothetical protein
MIYSVQFTQQNTPSNLPEGGIVCLTFVSSLRVETAALL